MSSYVLVSLEYDCFTLFWFSCRTLLLLMHIVMSSVTYIAFFMTADHPLTLIIQNFVFLLLFLDMMCSTESTPLLVLCLNQEATPALHCVWVDREQCTLLNIQQCQHNKTMKVHIMQFSGGQKCNWLPMHQRKITWKIGWNHCHQV